MNDVRGRIVEDLVSGVRYVEAALNDERRQDVPSEATPAVAWLVEGLAELVDGRSVRPAEVLFIPVLQLTADYLEAPGALVAFDEVERALRVAVMDLGDGQAPGVERRSPMLVAAVHLLDMVDSRRVVEEPCSPDIIWALQAAAKALRAARRADVAAQGERALAEVFQQSRFKAGR